MDLNDHGGERRKLKPPTVHTTKQTKLQTRVPSTIGKRQRDERDLNEKEEASTDSAHDDDSLRILLPRWQTPTRRSTGGVPCCGKEDQFKHHKNIRHHPTPQHPRSSFSKQPIQPTTHRKGDVNMERDAEEPLLYDLFRRLPDAICRHIFALRFHIFQSGSDLRCAVDKYLQGDASYQSIHEWDVSQVQDFSEVFSVIRNQQCRSFTADISAWNVSKATAMKSMFQNCEDFNADISRWDVGNVRNFRAMFVGCGRFNQDISKWSIGKATDFSYMFWKCPSFASDVSHWNVGNASNLHRMFYGCSAFCSDVSNWNVSKATDLSIMFHRCTVFNSDVSQWNVGKAINLSRIFDGCTVFNSDVSQWNVGNAYILHGMFHGCSSFQSDVSNWNISKARNLSYMFHGCSSFQSDVSNWNVSNAINLSYMFHGCTSFCSDVSRWNVSYVGDVNYMFDGCSAFCASAFFSGVLNWNLNDGVDRSNMFGDTGVLNLSDEEEDNE